MLCAADKEIRHNGCNEPSMVEDTASLPERDVEFSRDRRTACNERRELAMRACG